MALRRVFASRSAEHSGASGSTGTERYSGRATSGREHRVLDDCRTNSRHPAANPGRDFREDFSADAADAGYHAHGARGEAFHDREEPWVTCVVAHLLTSILRPRASCQDRILDCTCSGRESRKRWCWRSFPLCPLWLLVRGVLFETLRLFCHAQLHRPKLAVHFRPLLLQPTHGNLDVI